MSKKSMSQSDDFEEPQDKDIRPDIDNDTGEEASMPEEANEQEEPISEFVPPENLPSEDVVMSAAGLLSSVGSQMLEVYSALETQILNHPYAAGSSIHAADAFEGAENIQAVGIGLPEDPASLGVAPGTPCLNVYVAEPSSSEQIKAVMYDVMGISAASSDDLPVNPLHVGFFEAQPHRFKIRPAPGGVSVGHYRITAGTIGCLARGRRAPRNARLLILSNNHVLANSNDGKYGDSIIQPGAYDGGVSTRDRIAILERFVPLLFGSGNVNYVDAATGWAWPALVRRELVYLSKGQPLFFRISNQVAAPYLGMIVGKSGRTTQLTVGRIIDINWSGWVNYGSGRKAFFRDQFVIRGLSGDFSAGGDSGSSIWTWNNQRYVVGLLFAGGGGLTIANKMGRVLDALDINLYT